MIEAVILYHHKDPVDEIKSWLLSLSSQKSCGWETNSDMILSDILYHHKIMGRENKVKHNHNHVGNLARGT